MKKKQSKSLAKASPLMRKVDDDYRAVREAKSQKELKTALQGLVNGASTLQEDFEAEELKQSILELHESPKNKEQKIENLVKDIHSYSRFDAIENGAYLESTLHDIDKPLARKLHRSLIQEYKAKSPSDRLVINLLSSAYFRAMRTSSAYSVVVQKRNGNVSKDKMMPPLLKELNKTVESANRQVLSLLTYLKQRGQKPVKVNIKTQGTYIAQNQQFNKNA